jgi:hypothetical protein
MGELLRNQTGKAEFQRPKVWSRAAELGKEYMSKRFWTGWQRRITAAQQIHKTYRITKTNRNSQIQSETT